VCALQVTSPSQKVGQHTFIPVLCVFELKLYSPALLASALSDSSLTLHALSPSIGSLYSVPTTLIAFPVRPPLGFRTYVAIGSFLIALHPVPRRRHVRLSYQIGRPSSRRDHYHQWRPTMEARLRQLNVHRICSGEDQAPQEPDYIEETVKRTHTGSGRVVG
jgi:hypothetical protein